MLSIIIERVHEMAPASVIEQESCLQEIMQYFILNALAQSDFFEKAQFHGGTCLRIMERLNRFSEDLDFLLKTPDSHFEWAPYLKRIVATLEAQDIDVETREHPKRKSTVRVAMIKTDIANRYLYLHLPFRSGNRNKKLKIKLEIDIDPPKGSTFRTGYLDFPMPCPITVQTLSSGFALKLHALLCRTFTKGRDWYDFLWYVRKKVQPNLVLLTHALDQAGPWRKQAVIADTTWISSRIREKIESFKMDEVMKEIKRFVRETDKSALAFWNRDLFLGSLQKFKRIMGDIGRLE